MTLVPLNWDTEMLYGTRFHEKQAAFFFFKAIYCIM
jgi:hypothetical protein